MKITKRRIKQIIAEELARVREISAAALAPAGAPQEETSIQPLTPEQSTELEEMANSIKAMAPGNKDQIQVILAQLSSQVVK
jgi:hypothetical protein